MVSSYRLDSDQEIATYNINGVDYWVRTSGRDSNCPAQKPSCPDGFNLYGSGSGGFCCSGAPINESCPTDQGEIVCSLDPNQAQGLPLCMGASFQTQMTDYKTRKKTELAAQKAAEEAARIKAEEEARKAAELEAQLEAKKAEEEAAKATEDLAAQQEAQRKAAELESQIAAQKATEYAATTVMHEVLTKNTKIYNEVAAERRHNME